MALSSDIRRTVVMYAIATPFALAWLWALAHHPVLTVILMVMACVGFYLLAVRHRRP